MSDSKNGLLGLGSRGAAVLDVRTRLAALASDDLPELRGLLDAPVDDAVDNPHEVYDVALERAVRAFQQHKGLIVDGVVGVETFGAIDGARWTLGDRILVHTPGHLQRGEDVASLQERLNTLGFAAGRVDGRFGPETERAVRALPARLRPARGRVGGPRDAARVRGPAPFGVGRLVDGAARA